MVSGHWTAAAVCGDKWYAFNDSLASEISSRAAHRGDAQILCYELED
jgi:ubiquitin C-terminal hydrolase